MILLTNRERCCSGQEAQPIKLGFFYYVMEIQTLKINEINPAVYNPRKDLKPGDLEYEKLKKSILEFDMVEPLVWNKRTKNLVGGHQRLKILKELGIQDVEISVVDLSEVKEKALNLALNKISGEWDYPRLKDLLEELDTGELDIEITGFDDKEIENLMTQFHPTEDDLPIPLTDPDFEGVDTRGDYLLLACDNEVGRSFWLERLGIKEFPEGKRIITIKDIGG